MQHLTNHHQPTPFFNLEHSLLLVLDQRRHDLHQRTPRRYHVGPIQTRAPLHRQLVQCIADVSMRLPPLLPRPKVPRLGVGDLQRQVRGPVDVPREPVPVIAPDRGDGILRGRQLHGAVV